MALVLELELGADGGVEDDGLRPSIVGGFASCCGTATDAGDIADGEGSDPAPGPGLEENDRCDRDTGGIGGILVVLAVGEVAAPPSLVPLLMP